MAAVDLDQAYAPWLTSTGNLSANLEVYDDIMMDNAKDVHSRQRRRPQPDEERRARSCSTRAPRGYGRMLLPTSVASSNPKGRNIALFPSVTLNPPWTKKYFLKLQAIEVMGGDSLYGPRPVQGREHADRGLPVQLQPDVAKRSCLKPRAAGDCSPAARNSAQPTAASHCQLGTKRRHRSLVAH